MPSKSHKSKSKPKPKPRSTPLPAAPPTTPPHRLSLTPHVIAHIAAHLAGSQHRSLISLSLGCKLFKEACEPVVRGVKRGYEVVRSDGKDSLVWGFNVYECKLIQHFYHSDLSPTPQSRKSFDPWTKVAHMSNLKTLRLVSTSGIHPTSQCSWYPAKSVVFPKLESLVISIFQPHDPTYLIKLYTRPDIVYSDTGKNAKNWKLEKHCPVLRSLSVAYVFDPRGPVEYLELRGRLDNLLTSVSKEIVHVEMKTMGTIGSDGAYDGRRGSMLIQAKEVLSEKGEKEVLGKSLLLKYDYLFTDKGLPHRLSFNYPCDEWVKAIFKVAPQNYSHISVSNHIPLQNTPIPLHNFYRLSVPLNLPSILICGWGFASRYQTGLMNDSTTRLISFEWHANMVTDCCVGENTVVDLWYVALGFEGLELSQSQGLGYGGFLDGEDGEVIKNVNKMVKVVYRNKDFILKHRMGCQGAGVETAPPIPGWAEQYEEKEEVEGFQEGPIYGKTGWEVEGIDLATGEPH